MKWAWTASRPTGASSYTPEDARFSDGSTGREGKNRYARDYTAAYARFIGPERALFSRAGFAGQHRTPMLWAGDQQSVNSELASALRAGLSAALSGIAFWGFDIAGFAGPLPSPELYLRATQLACFCPVMQWHSEPDGGQFRELMPGAEGNNERSPWNMERAFGLPGFAQEVLYWHRLREALLPYLLETARDCAAQGRPMLRPLVYYWPRTKQSWTARTSSCWGTTCSSPRCSTREHAAGASICPAASGAISSPASCTRARKSWIPARQGA